jgi:hypothetical protein
VRFPAPTRADHQKFCEREGWTHVRNARGKTGTHHVTYELTLPDGRVLRTRISHPPDRSTYGRAIWAHILRDQLEITEKDFWACLRDSVIPARATPKESGAGIPAAVIYQLITHGVPEVEIAKMTKAEALATLNEFWANE